MFSPTRVVSIELVVFQMNFKNLSTSIVLTFFFIASLPRMANFRPVSLVSSKKRVTASFSISEREFHMDARISSMLLVIEELIIRE